MTPPEELRGSESTLPARPFYQFIQALTRILWRLRSSVHLEGEENLPAGAFIMVANHQSVLDPILLQSFMRRPIYAMAKSTQFSVPVIGSMMRRLCAFPARRYQVDPPAVRTTLRLIREGRPVVIYIEGERSWNARLQAPRRGTVRLLLRAGVPIVPVVITGSYDAWPRWGSLRPSPVRIRILPPLALPTLRGAANRAAVPAAADQVMNILRSELEATRDRR